MNIKIIVPIFNDGRRGVETLKNILRSTKRNVIVVNDGSTDTTGETLRSNFGSNSRVEILTHEVNYGKGAAMRTGVERAWSLGANAVIFIDADGQHDPKLLPMFESEIKRHPLVFGFRAIDNNMPFFRRIFNHCIRHTIWMLFGLKKRDLFCGYLAIRKKIYKKIKWTSNRYGIETEMASKAGRRKIPFKEIKIATIYLGKKHGINWKDGIKILLKIPVWYFSR